jgi:hypothetical protein
MTRLMIKSRKAQLKYSRERKQGKLRTSGRHIKRND